MKKGHPQPKNTARSDSPAQSETTSPLPPADEQLDLCKLCGYDTSPKEAWQAIKSSRQAYDRLFSKSVFGVPSASSIAHVEWAIFRMIKKSADPAGELADLLTEPFWRKRLNDDVPGFIRRLHDVMESKKTDNFDLVDRFLVLGWTCHALRKLPPFCLMTDQFLGLIFGLSGDLLRQRVARLKLNRPSRPRITGREILQDGKFFIKIATRRKAPALSLADFMKFVTGLTPFQGTKIR